MPAWAITLVVGLVVTLCGAGAGYGLGRRARRLGNAEDRMHELEMAIARAGITNDRLVAIETALITANRTLVALCQSHDGLVGELQHAGVAVTDRWRSW